MNEFIPKPENDKLKVVSGDLLALAEAGEFDLIVHGCNCFHTMGGGIARQIREKYPTAYMADLATRDADYNKLGTYSLAPSDQDPKKFKFGIVNAYTQYECSHEQDVFEYEAFDLILRKLAHEFPTASFGFPLIGCGLAGGDERRVLGSLEVFARKIDGRGGSVTLVMYKP